MERDPRLGVVWIDVEFKVRRLRELAADVALLVAPDDLDGLAGRLWEDGPSVAGALKPRGDQVNPGVGGDECESVVSGGGLHQFVFEEARGEQRGELASMSVDGGPAVWVGAEAAEFDTPPLTARQKHLIRGSFAQLEPAGELVGQLVYLRLFQLERSLRILFEGPLAMHGRRLMGALKILTVSLDRLDGIGPVLRLLGGRHRQLGVRGRHYVAFARARGLPSRYVLGRYVLKNALIPVVTAAGLIVVVLVGGAVLVEVTFGLEGLGTFLVDSVTRRDIPVIQGLVLLTAVFVIVVNLGLDVLYTVIDPRIRFEKADA